MHGWAEPPNEQNRLAMRIAQALRDEGVDAHKWWYEELGPVVLIYGAPADVDDAIELLAHLRDEAPETLRALIALGGI